MGARNQSHEMMQFISEGFVLVDDEFRVLEMNQEGLRIEGRPIDEIVGRTIWDAWPNIAGTELGRLWELAMRDKVPVSLEHHYAWPDGREAWLEMRAYPAEGGLAVFYRDVTEEKRTREELRRMQSELVHASRLSAMGAMASTLAHELSQPLAVVSNYLASGRRLLQQIPAAEAREARQALTFASAANERATELLRRLRAFVAKGKTETESHDIQAIIADASVLVLPHAQNEGVEIRFELDRFAKWVEADAVQIQQVLINLIKNAIEAMHESEVRRIVISATPAAQGFVEIAVRDTGPGLDETLRANLFRPFSSGKREGLGVGLSISRTIVEAHGGTITADAAEEGGAVFRFTLPRGSQRD